MTQTGELPTIKVALVGLPCGRTSLLQYLAGVEVTGRRPYWPDIFEPVRGHTKVDGQVVALTIQRIWVDNEYEKILGLLYAETDVVVLAYDVSEPRTLEAVRDKYHPEIRKHLPKTPYVLVGLKKDLREDHAILEALRQRSLQPVTVEKGKRMASDIGARGFLECSAKAGEGVGEVFEYAARVAIGARKEVKKTSCAVM